MAHRFAREPHNVRLQWDPRMGRWGVRSTAWEVSNCSCSAEAILTGSLRLFQPIAMHSPPAGVVVGKLDDVLRFHVTIDEGNADASGMPSIRPVVVVVIEVAVAGIPRCAGKITEIGRAHV